MTSLHFFTKLNLGTKELSESFLHISPGKGENIQEFLKVKVLSEGYRHSNATEKQRLQEGENQRGNYSKQFQVGKHNSPEELGLGT